MLCVSDRYKAHLVRKTWDRLAQAKMFGRVGANEAAVIIDYGQKVEPTGQVESQSECFGKAGISQFGATFLMPASSFDKTKLEEMLGEERTKGIKPGDMVVFTAVLYNADANQDWLHSLVSLRACIVLLQERFPNIKTLRLRTDGAGNFRNSSFVLLMPKLSQWTGVNILEFSVSEAGGGKDLTDSLIMQQKQRIREGVKQTGGSARNATECVATVQKGEEQVGSRGSCATREMIYNRPSGGVIGAKKGALPGISTMYHYQYEFAEADVFVGIRVFFHEGIGCGKFYTANDCDSMLLKHEGLNEATVGELRMATSTLQEGDVARERAAGQGARLLRGEEHKDFDADVRLQKQVKKNDVTAQKQETAKDTAATAVAESGVMLCQYCSQPFVRQKCFRAHEDRCVEQSASRAAKRKTAVLRPAVDLAQDQVHSAASLSIGQGNLFRGQENKEMFFPTTIKFFPTPRDVSVVKEGWACKGASGVKGGAFKNSQRDFLVTLFNNNGGPKIRETDVPGR